MELKVHEVQIPDQIAFNYEELKQEIEEKVHLYETLVYTEDQVKAAKADRATLNRLKKALNDERIRREKEYMKPFADFKEKLNEIIKIIDTPVKMIDQQVKHFEDQQKAEKLEKIKEIFSGMNPPEWLALEMLFDAKWLNTTVKLSAIQTELEAKMDQITNALETCSQLPSYAFEAAEVYKNTLDLAKAVQEAHRLTEQAKRKAEHEAAIQAKAVEKAKPTASTVEAEPIRQQETASPKQWIKFEVLLSVDDARALKDFFRSRNIEFNQIRED